MGDGDDAAAFEPGEVERAEPNMAYAAVSAVAVQQERSAAV